MIKNIKQMISIDLHRLYCEYFEEDERHYTLCVENGIDEEYILEKLQDVFYEPKTTKTETHLTKDNADE